MKKYFELKKVVDPHQHMSKQTRDHLFDGMRLRTDAINNETFIQWTVGSEKDEYLALLGQEDDDDEDYESDDDDLEYEEESDEDDYDKSLFHFAKVDEWLLKHDFKKGEQIIVLFWW